MDKSKNEIKQPNFVFILSDDFGLYDLSFMGSDFYETPNIDRIAQEGIVFTQGYAASRVCSPSRASIMTGKSTARHGITDWIGAKSGTEWRKTNRHDKMLPADYNHVLAASDITLPEKMKEAGYKTFFAGKWHLGEKGSYPEDHGFDINKGGWEVGSPRGGFFSPWENPSLPNETDGENLSMRLGKETSKFIAGNKSEPFFAYLSFYAVHGPIQTSEMKWKKYRDKAEKNGIAESGFEMESVLPIRVTQDNPIYAGLVEQMDEAVGEVLKTLDELGLAEKTVVIFTSDNGGVASGDAFSTSNLPLRGGKGYQWEGGIREPYFIKVPWIKKKEVDFPVSGPDFYPTILDLANIKLLPAQHSDGISLLPLMNGENAKERALFWHYPHYGNQGGEPSSMIRRGDWKLIHYYEDDRMELYNLANDEQERNNVASANEDKVAELRSELDAYLNSVKANMGSLDPEFDQEKLKLVQKRRIEVQWPNLEKQRKRFLEKTFDPGNDWWGSKVTID